MNPANQPADVIANLSNSALRVRLAEIDSEIEKLQARVHHALDAIIYPILSLPVEITSEIFKQHLIQFFGSPSEADVLPFVDLARARDGGPLLLSHVCRAWRSIALNMPSLWSRVRVSSSETDPSDWQELLQCWLARAGNQSLDLDLTGGLDQNQTARLFSTVAPYSFQWRSFQCYWTNPVSIPNEIIRGRIPCLYELRLWIKRDDVGPGKPEIPIITAFSDAPALRKVELSYLAPKSVSLPWAQLTHLDLYGQAIDQAIQVLHQTPNLERLSTDLRTGRALHGVQPTPVVLGHVHELSLSNVFDNVTKYLPYFTVPGLKTLNVDSIFYDGHLNAAALLSMLTRSRCSLETVSMLCIYDFAITALAAMDKVRQVDLQPADWSSSRLAQFFSRLASDSKFLPNIRSLRIWNCGAIIPYTELVRMLAARFYNRRADEGKLESFHLIRDSGEVDPIPSAEVEDQLRGLRNAGLDIHIKRLNKRKLKISYQDFD
ncbi:F-box domain-containing protein [Favolaschia claudopus]|uniref:F-box domain-containing protein n=1 Tax=Favolaschia claudopus TaxID=2862362 RepID=A0AAW0BJ16_9AGAR